MWKALVLVVKSTTSLGRPYHPPGSAIYFDFSLSRSCISLFWGFLSNKNLVFTSCGRLFLLVYHNLTLKLRLIASQRSNRHHLKMNELFIGPFSAWIWTRISSFHLFCQLAGTRQILIYIRIWWSKRWNPMQFHDFIMKFRCLHLTVNSQWNCEFRCIGVRIGG